MEMSVNFVIRFSVHPRLITLTGNIYSSIYSSAYEYLIMLVE